MEKYFYHLDLPPVPNFFVNEAINGNYEIMKRPNLNWAKSSFHTSDLFKILQKEFGEDNCSVKYYCNPAYSYYDWHTDLKRGIGINWVVKTNPRAMTLYREPTPEGIPGDGVDPFMYNIIEVDYQGSKPTLINPVSKHCVINNYNDTRFIMSLSVLGTTYEEALPFFKTLKMDTYFSK